MAETPKTKDLLHEIGRLKKQIEELRKELPELPQARRERFLKKYKLPERDVETLVVEKKAGDYFEESVKAGADPKISANYIQSFLFSQKKWPAVKDFAGTMRIIEAGGAISSTIAKDILATSAQTGQSPEEIIKEKGLTQITDVSEIENIAKDIIAKNAKAVEDYKKGKETALQFLIGQMMAKTRGTVSPDLASKILKQLLK